MEISSQWYIWPFNRWKELSIFRRPHQISLTDKSATDAETKKARATVLLINGNGHVEICAKTMSAKCANTLPNNNNGILWTLLILLISDYLKAVWKRAQQALLQNFNQAWPDWSFDCHVCPVIGVLALLAVQLRTVSNVRESENQTTVAQISKIWLKACSLIRRSLKKPILQAKKLPVIKILRCLPQIRL